MKLAHTIYHSPNPALTDYCVILHGLLGNKFNWNSLAKSFIKNTFGTVLTMDARNHGESFHSKDMNYPVMTADAEHNMQALSSLPKTLLGHSMGGKTAMTLALSKPQLLSKLIVVDIMPVPTTSGTSQSMAILDAMLSTPLGEIPFTEALPGARKIVYNHIAPLIPEEGLRQFVLTNLMKQSDGEFTWKANVPVLRNSLSQLYDFPTFTAADAFAKPALFILGAESQYVKASDEEVMKQLFKNCHIVRVAGAGHWVHADRPNEFLKIVHDFVVS